MQRPHDRLGQYQQSIDLYEQSLTIFRNSGDRAGEGAILGNLGNVYNNLDQYQQAIDFYEQVLGITRDIGDRAGEGRAMGSLGHVYNLDFGQNDDAKMEHCGEEKGDYLKNHLPLYQYASHQYSQ